MSIGIVTSMTTAMPMVTAIATSVAAAHVYSYSNGYNYSHIYGNSPCMVIDIDTVIATGTVTSHI